MNMTPAISRSVAVRFAIYLIELYRNTISALRSPTCRFTPTCSQYAVEALSTHGLGRGLWLAVVRLLKCGPWHRGGWDPVPGPAHNDSDDDAASDGRNESHV